MTVGAELTQAAEVLWQPLLQEMNVLSRLQVFTETIVGVAILDNKRG